MDQNLPYRSPNLELDYDTAGGWIYARWIGTQSERDIRSGGRAMLVAMRWAATHHGCQRVLNDNRDVVGSWSHSLEWSATEWLPQMFEAGLRHFAWVLSPDGFAALSTLRMTGAASSGAGEAIRTFSDFAEAQTWLRRLRGN
jgi:hypothetical protein